MSLVLGLEVTPTVVRGAFLRTTLRSSEIERYAEAAVSQSTESASEADLLRAAVAEVVRHGGRQPDRIVASMNGDAASLRLIDLPAGVEKKAAEVLPGELGAVLPFEVDDAVIDYQIVDRDSSVVRLMTVAAPRESVAHRLRELQSAGVDPRNLAVGGLAFEGLGPLLGGSLTGKTLAIIDVGARSTDFAVLTDGRCTFARTISGGIDLVESGRRAQLGATLRRTLASYRAQRSERPSEIWLSGDTSTMESARQWLSQQLDIECGVATLPSAPGADDETLPKFTKAAALAGRIISGRKLIDLRQGEFASAAAAGQIRQHLRLIAACGVAILLSFGISLMARYRVARAEHEQLSTTLAEVSQDLLGEETRSAVHARELLTGGSRVDDPLPRFDAYDVLEAISESIPPEIQHDTRRLLIEVDDSGDDGRFELQGTVSSIAERDTLVDHLQAHPCFADVEKGSISTAVEDRKDYKLVVKVACTDGASSHQEEK